MKLATAALILAVLTTGCSDPKSLSKGKLKTIINAYLEQPGRGKLCADHGLRGFAAITWPVRITSSDTDRNLFKNLETLGFVTLKEKGSGFFGSTISVYDITPEGQKHFQKFYFRNAVEESGWCFADYRVGEVDNFTVPGTGAPVTTTEATYFPKITHTEAWAGTEAGKQISAGGNFENFEKTKQAIQLTLTGNGWVVGNGR